MKDKKMKDKNCYQVVIVGGGISGLHLANLMQKKMGTGSKQNVAIFEKSYRVGGRVKSQNLGAEVSGNIVIEEGAGRIMAGHQRVGGLIKRYGLEREKIWKTPARDAKLSRIVDKVRKYAVSHRGDLCEQLTYLELARLCLTPAEIEYYLANYGFGDEIHYLQAGHAVRQFAGDLRYDRKFYIMRGGLEGIVRGLEKENESKNIGIHMQHLLQKITYLGSKHVYPYKLEFEVFHTFRKVVVYAREIVLCIPPHALKHITFDLGTSKENQEICESVNRVCNMVHEGTLIRIYAKYRDAWLNKAELGRTTTTGGILRNIIPVMQSKGECIVQYYSDYNQAKELEQYRLAGGHSIKESDKMIKEVIEHEVKRELRHNPPDPEWLKMFYWNAGVHHWKPNVDIHREISNIQWNTFGCDLKNTQQHRIGIVGEAFCHNQGWIEGALENAEEFYKEWVKRRKMRLRSKMRIRIRANVPKYTMDEVAKHNKPSDAWTVIHGRVYDITKFIRKHPGGMIILNAVGKDGTKYFEYIQHPEYVRNIMEKYYRGVLYSI